MTDATFHGDGPISAALRPAIVRVLQIGIALGCVLIGLGEIVALADARVGDHLSAATVGERRGTRADLYPTTLHQLVNGLGHFDGPALVLAGIVVLILTPVARVVTSAAIFGRFRDRAFFLVTSSVAVVLIASLALGRYL